MTQLFDSYLNFLVAATKFIFRNFLALAFLLVLQFFVRYARNHSCLSGPRPQASRLMALFQVDRGQIPFEKSIPPFEEMSPDDVYTPAGEKPFKGVIFSVDFGCKEDDLWVDEHYDILASLALGLGQPFYRVLVDATDLPSQPSGTAYIPSELAEVVPLEHPTLFNNHLSRLFPHFDQQHHRYLPDLAETEIEARIFQMTEVRFHTHGALNSFPTTCAQYGPRWNQTGLSGLVVKAEPFDGCHPPTNAAALKRAPGGPARIALVERGYCPFSEKVRYMEAAGADAVLIVNNQPGALFSMSRDPSEGWPVRIPSMFMTQEAGARLLAELKKRRSKL